MASRFLGKGYIQPSGTVPLWRAGLPALECEALPKTSKPFYDCFAVERGQAPSPQEHRLPK
ncbi:hypothetical protein EI534_21700 [Pseudomonas frederiksbergensis]|nr:hypothetical protein [Pseudomonas frederiksbergensis]